MAVRGLAVVLLGGLILGGCMQSTVEVASEANLTPRDRKLLAAAPYEKATIPEPYKRHIVAYHRKEAPGTILIDSDARYLYYVLPEGKAIRYGVTVGEDATLEEVLTTMEKHQIRRLPITDERGNCAGIIAQADVAWTGPEHAVAELVREVSRDTKGASR